MGLSGKKDVQIDAKCNGDAFHRLFRYTPHDLQNIAPNHIKSCQLEAGEWGTVGTRTKWTYVMDGTTQSLKQVVEAVDDKNKSITYRLSDGEVMQAFKSLTATIRVDKKGENCLVTWSFEYEKMNEAIPDPDAFVDLANKVTNDISKHQFYNVN